MAEMAYSGKCGTLKIGSKVYPIEQFDMKYDREDVAYRTVAAPDVTQRVAGPTRISGEVQLGDVDHRDMVGKIGDVTVNNQRLTVIIRRVDVSCDTYDASKMHVTVGFDSTGKQPSKWDDMIDLIAEVCDG